MLHSRRRVVSVGALSATLVLGSALLFAGHAPAAPAGPRASGGVRTPPVAGVLDNLGDSSRPASSLPAPSRTSAGRAVSRPVPPGAVPRPVSPDPIGVAGGPVTVRYTFDAGVRRPIVDVDGRHLLRPLGQNGGRLRLVPQRGGLAVAYPDRCALPRERDCPRAILEGIRDDNLNPGRRPLRYGASVLMTHGDLADGANVVQKGYSVGGMSQFKLQVDHRQGHPSCVIAGQRARIYRAEPWIDVADGTWHALECYRTPNRLFMIVDGRPRASVPVPPVLAIANTEPLRIGGKGLAQGNDQFAGAIDDVFVRIGETIP
ncbi:LamG-like jellyroll fold domain-containing protein [Actinoplanes sp. GCM10030250]|uniref:LamG-like jellyroll fold domain-containing protein n=1 Tax=Actinoplanes sp. GCM10030250 TaxID=3273376 RepID=UPI0036115CB9